MSGVNEQLPTFTGEERFANALLGLLSETERFISLLAVERNDGGHNDDGPIADFALGIVALRRTLVAVLSTGADRPAASPVREGDAEEPRWLR